MARASNSTGMSSFEEESDYLRDVVLRKYKQLAEKYGNNEIPSYVQQLFGLTQDKRKSEEQEEEMQTDEIADISSESSCETSSGSSSRSNSSNRNSNRSSDYQVVGDTNKRKPKTTPIKEQPKRTRPAENINQFAILGKQIEKEERENRFVIPPRKKPTTGKQQEVRQVRPPPIIAHGLDYKEFSKIIQDLEDKPKFFVKFGAGRKCTFKPSTEADRKTIFNLLKKMEVDLFTFTPKEEKKTTLVLKGVQHTFENDEVKQLVEEALPGFGIQSVTRLATSRTREAGKKLDAFIISFDAAYDPKRIMQANRILGQIVHWEKHDTKGISQCKRCQRYGHVASNCAQKYRCVKCSRELGPGECSRINFDADSKPFCVNCQKGGHPANYRGCPRYKEVNIANKKKQEQQKQREIFIQEATRNYVQPGKSFAQILNPNKPTTRTNIINKPPPRPSPTPKPAQKTSQADVDNFCTQEAKALFGCDLFTLMGKINQFVPKYRKLTTLAERQSAYLQFAFQLCLGN